MNLQARRSGTYAYLRHTEDHDVLVVLNLSQEAIAGYQVTARDSAIPPGSYSPRDLLGQESLAPLTVGAGGSVAGYAPLPALAPLTGYVSLMR